MHSLLSLLSSAVLAAMVYGLSFFPSATLGQIDEVEHAISRTDQNGANPDSQDAQGQSDGLQS
jgi:hypothetical protein